MSEIVCPRCGAKGNESCSTLSGRDHIARIRAEIATITEPDGRECKLPHRAGYACEGCGVVKPRQFWL